MRKRSFLQTPRPPRPAPLPRGARWAARLSLLLPPLVFLALVAGPLVRLTRLLNANVSPIAAAAITLQTGHETRLGRVSYFVPGVLSIDNVAISSRATFATSHGEAIVRADRVTIHYALASLLLDSGNAQHALGDIVVDRPTVLIEQLAKNRFNFSDIITTLKKLPHKPHQKPFAGQVIIHDATLHFRDYLAPARLHERPALNELDHVASVVNLHSPQTAYFVGTGQGTANRLATFAVSGDASRLVTSRFRVAAQVTDADAAYWTDYFKAFPQARVIGGRADVDMTFANLGGRPPPGLPMDILGRVAVRRADVSLTFPALRRLPVRGLTGSADFTGDGLNFSAVAALAGQPVAASGTLFDFLRPQLAATATANGLDARRLAQAVPSVQWPAGLALAPGAAKVDVVGPLNTPTISTDLTFPSAQYAGNRITGLRASAVYSGQTLTVPAVSFGTVGGGQVSLRGTVGLGKTPVVRLSGQARMINLASLRIPGSSTKKLGLGGLADAQVLADNIGHPLRIDANVAIARPHVGKTTLISARARLAYAQGQGLTISRALVRSAQGATLVSGSVPAGAQNGRWDLNVDAAGLNLAALAGPYTKAPIGGLAYFRGRVQGPAATPQAVGQVQLLNPRFQRFTADVVSGGLTTSANGIRLNDMVVRRFPAAAHISGTVTKLASADPLLDLGVSLSQAELQDFINIAGDFAPPSRSAARKAAALPPISGAAQGAFRVVGSVHSPRVSGQVTVADGTIGPYRVDSLRVRAAYAGGTVRVNGATLEGEGATVSAHGSLVLQSGRVQAAFSASNIDPERFRDLTDAYVDLDGILGVSGTVGGTLKSPAVAASLTGQDVSVNGQPLAAFTLAGRYADGVFMKTGSPWAFDFQPTAQLPHDVRYVVNALRLTLPTQAHPRRAPALALDAAISADAPESVPHLIATLRGSRFAATPAGRKLLAQIDSLPRPLAGEIAVPRLSVRGPLTAPDVQADVQANGLALGVSRIGALRAHASFADPKNPAARLSATAQDLDISGVPIGTVTALASLAHHVVTLDSLRATSERAFLEASGRADLNGDITANLDASDFPLSLLDPLLPQPATERRTLTGELSSLSISASGPTRAPNLTASVTLANPGLAVGLPGKPPSVTYALERVRSGTISLSTPTPGGAQVLSITDLAAYQGGRPIASLSGTLPFEWHGAAGALPEMPDGQPLHAQLVVQDLSQLAPFTPFLDAKKTAGTLTASLDVSGAGDARRLAGALDLTNGAVGLNGFDTALVKLNAHLALADNRVTVQRLVGASSKGGTFAVTGSGTLGEDGGPTLHLAAKNLALDESSGKSLLAKTYSTAFKGTVNGSIDVDQVPDNPADTNIARGTWLKPVISTPVGAPLLITDASGTIPSPPSSSGAPAGPPLFDPSFDLAVQLGGGKKTVTVSNALLRADANGSVTLAGRLSAPELYARLSIVRGQLILPPATRLKFVHAAEGNTVIVKYPVFDPDTGEQTALKTTVNLTAVASVSISQAQLAAFRPAVSTGVEGESAPYQVGNTATNNSAFGQTQRYTITAHIHGVLNDPNLAIDLTSSPAGLQRQDMLVALTGVSSIPGLLGSNAQGVLVAGVTGALYSFGASAFLTPVEENIANGLGLTDFDVAYAPDSPVLVTLSKELLPRLEVTYIRSFGASAPGTVNSVTQPPQYTLKLSYGLTRRLQVSVSTDDQRENTVALEGVLGF